MTQLVWQGVIQSVERLPERVVSGPPFQFHEGVRREGVYVEFRAPSFQLHREVRKEGTCGGGSVM
jgi:hypothetical protein